MLPHFKIYIFTRVEIMLNLIFFMYVFYTTELEDTFDSYK